MNVGRHTWLVSVWYDLCYSAEFSLVIMGPMCDGAGIGVTPPVLGGHDHLPQKIKKTIHGGGELQGGEVRFHIPDWEGLWLPCWMQAPAVMWISHLAVAVYRKLENAGAKALHKSLFLTFDCTKSSQTVDKSGQNEIFFSWCLTFLIMAEWEAKKKRKKTGRKLEMSHCFSHWEEPAGSCTWLCGS